MTKRKDSSSIREIFVVLNSNIVFKEVVKRFKKQKTEVESLLQERNLLQDVIRLERERWKSDVNLFKDRLDQMKQKLTLQDMERKIADANSDVLLILKQRESYIYHLEKSDRELGDFREWFDILSLKLSELKDMPKFSEDLKTLKSVIETLLLQKNSKISALLAADKNNSRSPSQYNEMESRLKEQLQEKDDVIECEKKKIQMILSDMEELRSSNAEKYHVIEQLKSEMVKLEADSMNKNEKISMLSKELDSLKRSRGNSVTPLPHRCSLHRGKNNPSGSSKVVSFKRESDSETYGKICRCSKGKAVEITTIANSTPRLFTSSFKVPKLKSVTRMVV